MKIDPTRIFEIKGQVYKLLVASDVALVGNNKIIVAAASGKITRVMGWLVSNATTTSGVYFSLHSSGGAKIATGVVLNANNAAGYAPGRQPITESGYGETVVGESLQMDIGTDNIYYNVYYITYTPS